MRDPALAAAMGVFSGSDFGARRPRLTRRTPQPVRRQPGADFGFGFSDDYGFGDEAGFGQAAAPPPPPPSAGNPAPHIPVNHPAHPHHPQHAKHQHVQHHNTSRELMLDPNKYSKVKIQGYSFSLNAALVLNVASTYNVTLSPSAKIHPKRAVTNITSPAMVYLTSLQVANVNVLIGATDDAYVYGPSSFGMVTEFPTLDTSLRATMAGNYSGFVPPGYTNNFAYTYLLTFQGPAALAGNG